MENEQARLKRVYAEKSDLELTELAREAGSLTDVARRALDRELAARGIGPVKQKEETPNVEQETDGFEEKAKVSGPLVMIKRFRDLPEAFVAKSILDSAQIDSFLADENLVRIDWLYSNLIGGAKLMVRPEDVAEATALLDESANEANATKNSEETDTSSARGEASE